ncbi:MAG: hypothetical protein GY820_35880 [Gammaproteobacteria bacterium]|nr:hypothetical protein [Gammaproteobacteria bacterium]
MTPFCRRRHSAVPAASGQSRRNLMGIHSTLRMNVCAKFGSIDESRLERDIADGWEKCH